MEEQSHSCSELNCFPQVFIKSNTQQLGILQTLLQSAAWDPQGGKKKDEASDFFLQGLELHCACL